MRACMRVWLDVCMCICTYEAAWHYCDVHMIYVDLDFILSRIVCPFSPLFFFCFFYSDKLQQVACLSLRL
jgi:hypothetical protein